MNAARQYARFWQAVALFFDDRHWELAPHQAEQFESLFRDAVRRMDAEGADSPTQVRDAQRHLERILIHMEDQARGFGLERGPAEDMLSLALDSLCPLWPFC